MFDRNRQPVEGWTHTAPTGDRYRIAFWPDDSPYPPWEDEGAVPVMALDMNYRRSGYMRDGDRGYNLDRPLDYLSDSKIAANLPQIVGAFPAVGPGGRDLYHDPATFDSFVRDEYRGLGMTLREARREWLAEYLRDGEVSGERLRLLATLWQLAGVPAEVMTVSGYAQGDVADVLAVAHPEAVTAWGFERHDGRPDWRRYRKTCPNDLRQAAVSWAAWAWGDVLVYTVEHVGLDGEADPEPVDSCWGFYPEGNSAFPFESAYGYAIEQATGEADADARRRAEIRAADYAAEMIEARPDLAPQYEGAGA